MADVPEANPARQAWDMLLNGWGYNWYRHNNRMRADDLLIRGQACDCLHRAIAALRRLETAHRRTYLPPPSRERPYADSAGMMQLREIQGVRAAIEAAEVQVRGSAVPTDDKVWQYHRDNAETLARLIEIDLALVEAARGVEAAGAEVNLPPAPLDLHSVEARLARLIAIHRQRQEQLDMPQTSISATDVRFTV